MCERTQTGARPQTPPDTEELLRPGPAPRQAQKERKGPGSVPRCVNRASAEEGFVYFNLSEIERGTGELGGRTNVLPSAWKTL